MIIFKRTTFSVMLLLLAAVGVATWGDPAAACSTSDHCYADAIAGVAAKGIAVSITPSCLTAPYANDVSNEIWLIDARNPSAVSFVEVGYLQMGGGYTLGTGSYTLSAAGRYGFWADQRPGHAYAIHVLQSSPSLTAGAFISITANGTNAWQVYFNGHTNNSTSNSMVPNNIEYGSEATSAAATDYGLAVGAEYQDSGGTWHNGMNGPTVPAPDTPQKFSWVTKSTSYHAGAPC
jgi:hypothetical protein